MSIYNGEQTALKSAMPTSEADAVERCNRLGISESYTRQHLYPLGVYYGWTVKNKITGERSPIADFDAWAKSTAEKGIKFYGFNQKAPPPIAKKPQSLDDFLAMCQASQCCNAPEDFLREGAYLKGCETDWSDRDGKPLKNIPAWAQVYYNNCIRSTKPNRWNGLQRPQNRQNGGAQYTARPTRVNYIPRRGDEPRPLAQI